MIPDINHLILPLVAYRHRHDIQPRRYHLSLMVTAIPGQGNFSRREGLLLRQPVDQPSAHVVDLDTDLGRFVQLKGDGSLDIGHSATYR